MTAVTHDASDVSTTKTPVSPQLTISTLRSDFLTKVRTEGLDDLGQPVVRLAAEGGEPCRDVLRRARPGEQLILASYTPFAQSGPYREFGPVFLLANGSDEPVRFDTLPKAGSRSDYLQEQFVIRAYSHEQTMVHSELIQAGDLDATVDRLFEKPDAAYLHVRFPTAGCFACRIDRA